MLPWVLTTSCGYPSPPHIQVDAALDAALDAPRDAFVPFAIVSSTPADGDTDVSTTEIVVVDFNKPVNVETLAGISMTQGGVSFTAFDTEDPSSTTVLLHPTSALVANTTYVAMFPATVESTDGEHLHAVTVTFTTGP